jgi:hypothetical protein
LYFWLDPKVQKDQVSRYASLRSRPLPCKAGKTWGGGLLPPLCASPRLQATFQTPLQPHRPALFYLLSPEAARLTGHAQKEYRTLSFE